MPPSHLSTPPAPPALPLGAIFALGAPHSPASATYGSATAVVCRPSCLWWTQRTLPHTRVSSAGCTRRWLARWGQDRQGGQVLLCPPSCACKKHALPLSPAYTSLTLWPPKHYPGAASLLFPVPRPDLPARFFQNLLCCLCISLPLPPLPPCARRQMPLVSWVRCCPRPAWMASRCWCWATKTTSQGPWTPRPSSPH